jgi:hypothetical protein
LLADRKIELFDASRTKIGENDTFAANDPVAFASAGESAFLDGARTRRSLRGSRPADTLRWSLASMEPPATR